MDEAYWGVLRSLHSRTCLHARSVLALLSNGLVDPAWAQWRICHESSTIARFVAANPDTAPRYMSYSLVNKYHLANELFTTGHNQAPEESELQELKRLAENVRQSLINTYGLKKISKGYGWSGRSSFKEIEAEVFQGDAWNPRGHFVLASERVHSAPNAGEPREIEGKRAFTVGPTNFGLTGPADLTSISIVAATEALMLNAVSTLEDEETMLQIAARSRTVGVMCWFLDPEIFCAECEGYVDGASPPDEIPEAERPDPCSCGQREETL